MAPQLSRLHKLGAMLSYYRRLRFVALSQERNSRMTRSSKIELQIIWSDSVGSKFKIIHFDERDLLLRIWKVSISEETNEGQWRPMETDGDLSSWPYKTRGKPFVTKVTYLTI